MFFFLKELPNYKSGNWIAPCLLYIGLVVVNWVRTRREENNSYLPNYGSTSTQANLYHFAV